MSNIVRLDYQLALDKQGQSLFWLPDANTTGLWINESLRQIGQLQRSELTVRIVGISEITKLNSTYRSKDSATNVLSFPHEQFVELDIPLLGDLVICAEIVNNEALDQDKSIESHWAHILVHGCLHLFGFDHKTDKQANEMETLEILILNKLGFGDPYIDQLQRGMESVKI